MVPSLRSGQRSDIDRVLALWVTADAEPTHTDDAGSLQALIEHPGTTLLVAEDDEALVGSVIAGWDGWRGSVYRLVVAPTHRRQGLATRLLSAAQSHLGAVGAVRLQAVVVETETAAVGFWTAAGWDQQEHRLRFVTG